MEAPSHTHNVGAFGLKGISATGVHMGTIVGLQETDVVEAVGLWRKKLVVCKHLKDTLACCCSVVKF